MTKETTDRIGRRLSYEYSAINIARAAAAFRAGHSYKDIAKTIHNRRGDKTITPTQLKRRIDEYERRTATT